MKKFLKISLIIVVISFILGASGTLIYYLSITNNVVLHSNLLKNDKNNIEIYDKNNNLIINPKNEYIEYKDIPQHLINAIVATEDKRFYKHSGVDYIRIFGAIKNNIKTKCFSEGGSTISQQLIKNTHLTQEKSINRKLKEIKLAKILEKQYSKEEILEMYLNVVYFGCGQYGINEASFYYFNKKPNELTLSECATLTGILKNPKKYSPKLNIENSKLRKNTVLKLMLEQKYINNDEYSVAINENINVKNTKDYLSPYLSMVEYEATKILNINKKDSKIKIYTSFDEEKQIELQRVLENENFYIKNSDDISPSRLGIILDNKNATISSFYSSNNTNIFELKRPYGSTIKPILIYAAALKNNAITASTPVNDILTNFSGYEPQNYNDKYLGITTIRNAILTSSNVVAVKTYNTINVDKFVNFAKNIDIFIENNDKNATMALGAFSNNNMLSLISGYAMLGNLGLYQSPSFINKIYDENNNLLYEKCDAKTRVLDSADAYILTDILMENAEVGTAKGLNGLNLNIASKTGTVGDEFSNTDAYNIAYNKDNTYLIWHGISSGANMSLSETGGSYTTRTMRELLKNVGNSSQIEMPDNIVILPIDKDALFDGVVKTTNILDDDTYYELFRSDNTPLE